MRKQLSVIVLIAIILSFGNFIAPVSTLAQYDPNSPLYLDGGSFSQDITDEGFKWWWLLPLLILPIIYFIFRKGRDETYEYKSQVSFHDINAKDKSKGKGWFGDKKHHAQVAKGKRSPHRKSS